MNNHWTNIDVLEEFQWFKDQMIISIIKYQEIAKNPKKIW